MSLMTPVYQGSYAGHRNTPGLMSFLAIVFGEVVAVGKQLYCTTGWSLEMVLNLELSLFWVHAGRCTRALGRARLGWLAR